MWGNSGGSWLLEDKKANLFGNEGEILVAHGRLPSPTRSIAIVYRKGGGGLIGPTLTRGGEALY